MSQSSSRLPSRASGRDRVASLQADKCESDRHDGEEDPARTLAGMGHEVPEDDRNEETADRRKREH
jgi:hypothetical protein